MNGKYPLYIAGKERGSLIVKEDGLRVIFEAECSDDGAGLYRAAAIGNGNRIVLGVMAPEKGRLYIRRSFSKDELNRSGVSSVSSGEAFLSFSFTQTQNQTFSQPMDTPLPAVWQPARNIERVFKDPILAFAAAGLQGALTCVQGNIRMLAFPYQMENPFPLTPIFCFAQITRIEEKNYAVYKITAEGIPIL